MAKDKEKQQDQQQQHQASGNLFSGVDGDGRAITFQRAVFIVCNLKRIIRRPKKDQQDGKHLLGGSASSRKRSGDSGDANDRSSSGLPDGGAPGESHHGPGGKGFRFRNPIRRAFTLPVILCESFAGTGGGGATQQQRRLAAEPTDSDDLYTLDGPPQAPTGRSTAIETPPTTTSKLRFSMPADEGEQDHGRLRRSPARRQRRRDRRNTGTGTPPSQATSPLSFSGLERDIHGVAAAGQQLGSLSCLVTPIRRVNQAKRLAAATTTVAPSPNALPANQTSVFQRSPAGPHTPLPPPAAGYVNCHGNILQVQDRAEYPSPPICCPIWSLAMELLDMSQLQPRDQARHSHLLGAPASLPYLMVPTADEPHQLAAFNSIATTTTDQQLSLILPTGSDESANFQHPPLPDIQVDTGASDAQQQQQQQQDYDNDNEDDNDGQQHSREKRLSSESIGEQRMSCGKVSKGGGGGGGGGGSGSPERNKHSSSKQTNKLHRHQLEDQAAARMRMKRFSSSALCLNEPPTATTATGETDGQQGRDFQSGRKSSSKTRPSRKKTNDDDNDDDDENQRGGPVPKSSSSANSATCTPKKSQNRKQGARSSANTLAPTLETLDPIVQYARQRRPSVSNQGTLNVDQQALFSAVECNQLERVKSILDGSDSAHSSSSSSSSGAAPKVNVNSLNGDKLTCLDVAVLLRNLDMVRLLQAYGAKESSACLTREGRENQLYALYMEARRLVEDLSRSLDAIGGSVQPAAQLHANNSSSDLLGAAISPIPPASGPVADQLQAKPQQLMLATGSLLSSALFEEKQRQLAYWRRRLELFMQMRYGFEKLAAPNAPELVVLQVVGENSLGIKIVHSLQLSRESVSVPVPVLAGAAFVDTTLTDTPPSGNVRNCPSQLGSGQPQRRHRKPLRKLVARAQEGKLNCPLGLACSHWLMDEFVAHKHQLAESQFQMPTTSGGELPTVESSGGKTTVGGGSLRGPTEFATVKSARQRGAAINSSNASHNQRQERLAIFNHLLAQQLTILSNQQRQQQHIELVNNSRYRITNQKSPALTCHKQQPRPRPQHQLLCSHQAESTDSAYDNLAAAAASSRQHQQQAEQLSSMLTVQATSSLQFSPSSSNLTAYGANSGRGPTGNGHAGSGSASRHQQQPYRSLAYQLMSAKKRYSPVAACAGGPPHLGPTDSLPFGGRDGGGVSPGVGPEETAPLHSPDCADALGDGPTGLVQIVSEPPAVITKYLVEWSLSASFEPLAGAMLIYNTNSYPLECQIEQLENGRVHFVRVASGNHKGFSGPHPTTPTCLAPSSWRQVTMENASQVATNLAGRKRFKYDEEVFRKFTKLILLNRHILDKNQIQMLQREQQSLLSASSLDGRSRSDFLKSANLQNKSSLINMLLLDATLPAPAVSSGSRKTRNQVLLTSKLPVLDASASSPRGSLYPSSTSTRASVTGLGDQQGQAGGGYETSDSTASGEQQQTSLRVRKNLKSFFQSNSAKFTKLNNQNKRGLYLTTVIYCSPAGAAGSAGRNAETKDFLLGAAPEPTSYSGSSSSSSSNRKLVVTNDDRLPVIEILNDLVAPSSLMADFYWLLKINGTNWIDIKRLRQQLQKSHSSSTLHLRIKLLAAIEQMQVALNLEDIGRLFYKPIVAHDGSIVICTCRSVSNTKQVSNLSIKWTSQQKIIPRHLRNISDTIAFSAQQREKQLELQQQQLKRQRQQLQQQQRHHSTASTSTGGGGSGPMDGLSLSATCCQQAVGLTSGGSSSTHSSQDQLTATSSTPTTENMPTTTYNHVAAINLVTPPTCGQDEITCAGPGGGCSGGNVTQSPEVLGAPQQTTNNRLLSASNAQIAVMPPELARLCEFCQQALIQRRCTMASGSSSSSLASSQESQSWSSSQFSLTSQQVGASQRSCTCSRSNSANQVLAPLCQATPLYAHQYQQQNNYSPTTTCSALVANANNNSLSSHMVAVSAPTSQRNSTQSARSASGSMSMMMAMMMGGGGGGVANPGPNPNYHQTSGSFSLAQSSGGPTPSSIGGPQQAASSSLLMNNRQTQSQQLTEAAAPQKSSTFLMLASLGLYDLLLFHLSEIIEFDQASTRPLPRGLYLGFVQLQTTVESMRLLVPRRRPNMVPCARIRDNAHVSREEWELLKRFPLISNLCSVGRGQPQPPQPSGGGCTSSRSSDPAIWGGSTTSVRARCQDQESMATHNKSRGQTKLLNLETGSGFDRDRAKSVSPGLITCRAGGSNSAAAHLDMREARLGAAACAASGRTQHSDSSSALGVESSPLAGQGDQVAQQQQHAHSDTDLATQMAEVERAVGAASDSNLDSTAIGTARGQREDTPPRGNRTYRTRGRHVPSLLEQSPEMTFVRLIGDAARRLLSELKSQLPKHFESAENIAKSSTSGGPLVMSQHQPPELVSILNSLNDEPNNRIYHLELIELSNQVTFVLLIPAPENVCPVTSHDRSNILANNRDFMLLPLQIFETIHLATYEPDLLGKYSRLSTILETDLIVAQHEHRQAFSSHELKLTKSRVSHLQDMVAIADEFWRQLRWIVDVVSFARDKSQLSQGYGGGGGGGGGTSSTSGCLKLDTIWRHFDQLAMSTSRASITSASTIANLCCIETTCLTAATAAAAAGTTRQAGRPESEPTGPEGREATPRARTNSVDNNLTRAGLKGAQASRACDHLPSGRHAEIKRTSSAKQASSMARPRLPEIQLPSGEATQAPDQMRQFVDQKVDEVPLTVAVEVSPQVSLDEDETSILDVEFGVSLQDKFANLGQARQDGQHDNRAVARAEEEEEEAIYAYHISLRDATRAAAQRKSSANQQERKQQAPALVDQASVGACAGGEVYLPPPPPQAVSSLDTPDDDQLASTCGGLNLDRRQFEKFVAAATQTRATTRSGSSSSCASGHVIAYKCKVRESASSSSTSASTLVRLGEDCAGAQSGAPEQAPETTHGNQSQSRPLRTTSQMLKSTNPFLTDSFDL